MKDITSIDWKAPYGKIRSLNPAKQKVWYTQNGIEYDSSGKACNPKQVQKYLGDKASEAQAVADEAKEVAAAAQKDATAMLKDAGMTKTAARKAS